MTYGAITILEAETFFVPSRGWIRLVGAWVSPRPTVICQRFLSSRRVLIRIQVFVFVSWILPLFSSFPLPPPPSPFLLLAATTALSHEVVSPPKPSLSHTDRIIATRKNVDVSHIAGNASDDIKRFIDFTLRLRRRWRRLEAPSSNGRSSLKWVLWRE